jgi:hypothetical protein
MKQYKVLIPFHRSLDDKDYAFGDVIEADEVEVARIQSVNINMILEVEEKPKKKRAKKQ